MTSDVEIKTNKYEKWEREKWKNVKLIFKYLKIQNRSKYYWTTQNNSKCNESTSQEVKIDEKFCSFPRIHHDTYKIDWVGAI